MKKYFVLLLIATSCTPTYIPNIRNSPMFTGKGEVQLNFQVGNGLNAQGAVAVSNNFGVIVSYSYLERNNGDRSSANYRKHTFGEGGFGYFTNQENSFFEVFAGYGEGTGYSVDALSFLGASSNTAAGSYQRYFLQPAFGFNRNMMYVSFVPRFTLVDFTEFSTGGVRYLVDEDPTLFFEPAVIGRVNLNDNLYFTFQGGFALETSGEPFFQYRIFHLSSGLGVRFGGKKKAESRE